MKIDFEALPEVIGIIGSRTHAFPSLQTSAEKKLLTGVSRFVGRLKPGTTVISGGARGIDAQAAKIARSLGMTVIEFPVTDEEWKTIGKGAGHMRNGKLVSRVKLDGGMLFAFALADEQGKITPGTNNSLTEHCKRLDVPWMLYRIDRETGAWLEPMYAPMIALHEKWRKVLVFDN